MSRFFARFSTLLILSAQLAQAQTTVQAAPPAAAAARRAPPVNRAALDGLDQYIAEQMKEWNVPGLAVAIVWDGEVIHSKGYGFRDIEKRLPVTPKTLFAIGSITKSFAVVTLGMLADEGKFDWDKPVREYLPNFTLYDPVASERITGRDVVSHRSGLPGHDAFMYDFGVSQEEMIERLRYLEPSHDLRTEYQYSNLLFMVAGYLAGHIAGTTWEELTRRTLFIPLGMNRTNFSVRESYESGDFALPYTQTGDGVKEIPHPFLNFPEEGAAGIINSNVEDMARYLLFYLNEGSNGESQLLSRNQIRQMQTSTITMPRSRYAESLGENGYGMGLYIQTYRGHRRVSHGGGLGGFRAALSFMPSHKSGVVVLTNTESPLNHMLALNVHDRLLGLEQVPWTRRFKEGLQKQKESAAEAEKKGYTTRKKGTRPSHILDEYPGDYEHPGFGIITIGRDKEELTLLVNNRRLYQDNKSPSPLGHVHYDIFEFAPDADEPDWKVKVIFGTNFRGEIDHLQIPLDRHVKPILFTRRPAKRMTEKSFLEHLTGEYELAWSWTANHEPVTVSLRGDGVLVLTNWRTDRPYELVPARGLLFDIKGLTEFAVEFKKDASGRVAEMVLYEPNRTLVGRKIDSR